MLHDPRRYPLTLSTNTRLYLLGPMTGYPQENRPTFKAVSIELRQQGFDVVSPDELDTEHPTDSRDWQSYLKRDIPFVLTCDAGVALPGWQKSRGARLEATILTQLQVPIYNWPSLELIPTEDLPRIVLG